MVENASLFLSYRELQNLIKIANHQHTEEASSMPQIALAGAGAGAITSFLLCVFFSRCYNFLKSLFFVSELQ
jgi:ornithine carrier protein